MGTVIMSILELSAENKPEETTHDALIGKDAIVKCSCCKIMVRSAIQYPVHGNGVGILCRPCLKKGLDIFDGTE